MVAIDLFDPKSLILMLGGSSKKSDFSTLATKIAAQNVRAYLYGKEGERIKIELDGVIESGMNVVDPTDVEDILTGKKGLD